MERVSEEASGIAAWVRKYATRFNFYRAHLLYFIVAILISSAVFWASNTNGYRVNYIDALTMCASAMTNCGLTTIDLSSTNAYQQSILFVLMALGDLSIASISVVYMRRYFFGKKIHKLLKTSKAARRLAEDIEEHRADRHAEASKGKGKASAFTAGSHVESVKEAGSASDGPRSDKTSQRTNGGSSHQTHFIHHGYGGLPALWETRIFKYLVDLPSRKFGQSGLPDHHYLSFSPELDSRGRFRNLKSEQLEELGGVEYRALGVLTWLLPAYTMFWLCFGWVILLPWTTRASVSETIRTVQPGDTNPQWWALFVGLSAYSNTGLNLTDQNMIPFSHDYLILIVTGAVILGGNTFYPIFLRLTIWSLSKIVPKHSQLHHSLAFLLHHPRRCFLFLFPAKSTWYLFGIQVAIFFLVWLAFEILNIGYTPIVGNLGSVGQRLMDGLYQIHGVRSSGFYITNQSNLAPACQVFFMVSMYISAIPFILSLRSTNIYEERSVGMESDENESTHDTVPKKLKPRSQEGLGLQEHLQNQLAYDLWWLILAVFLVTIIERGPLAATAPGFTIFSVIFEVVSAYGTVGLSLGVPNANTSFCGAWKVLSRLVLITVMLRGRHRILPLAIDRAVLLPGQRLMKKLDEEDTLGSSEDRGTVWRRYEEEIRKEEEGSQAEHGGQQDPEGSSASEQKTGTTSESDSSDTSQTALRKR